MNSSSPDACDVLCVGLIVADHVAAPIEAIPLSGGLACTARTELTIGGCAANVAVDLTKLGVSASVVGCVGDDVLGRYVCDELASAGVDCSQIIVSSQTQTSTTLVVNVLGEDRRFIHVLGANGELRGTEIDPDILKHSKIIYVGGFGLNAALSGENVAQLFAQAREAGVRTVLDVVIGDPITISDMLAPVLPVTDLFLPNTDEASVITGLDDPLEQAKTFQQKGAETVIVTCGGQGSVVFTPNERVRVPIYEVAEVDGTGGGDAFASGLMYGLLVGKDLIDCVKDAAAMGASCVRATGATTGTFNARELQDFVASHTLTLEPISG
ncbi:MAG: carbohydrate kinase family protein [Planctomycetaceae bacterium]|nr:carbohydrate kinase family protein [Planctomycetaceae bacterium]